MARLTLKEFADQYAAIRDGQVKYIGPDGAVVLLPNQKEIILPGPLVVGWYSKCCSIIGVAREQQLMEEKD